jgi:hypothetical protein
MIRASVLLCLMLTTVSVRAETIQRLERDTSSPSLVDLSNGEPGWGDPVRRSSAPGANMSLLNGAHWGAPRMRAVSGYIRRDGTYVAPTVQSLPRR